MQRLTAMLALALRDVNGKAHVVRDPATGHVAAFEDADLAWALHRYLTGLGANVAGLFAPPVGTACRTVRGEAYARHVADSALRDAQRVVR